MADGSSGGTLALQIILGIIAGLLLIFAFYMLVKTKMVAWSQVSPVRVVRVSQESQRLNMNSYDPTFHVGGRVSDPYSDDDEPEIYSEPHHENIDMTEEERAEHSRPYIEEEERLRNMNYEEAMRYLRSGDTPIIRGQHYNESDYQHSESSQRNNRISRESPYAGHQNPIHSPQRRSRQGLPATNEELRYIETSPQVWNPSPTTIVPQRPEMKRDPLIYMDHTSHPSHVTRAHEETDDSSRYRPLRFGNQAQNRSEMREQYGNERKSKW